MTDEEYSESLIDCPECKRSIDEDSTMCLGCGYFLLEKDRYQSAGLFQAYRGCFIAIAILLILFFVLPLIGRFF